MSKIICKSRNLSPSHLTKFSPILAWSVRSWMNGYRFFLVDRFSVQKSIDSKSWGKNADGIEWHLTIFWLTFLIQAISMKSKPLIKINTTMNNSSEHHPSCIPFVVNLWAKTNPFQCYMFDEDLLKSVKRLSWWKSKSYISRGHGGIFALSVASSA